MYFWLGTDDRNAAFPRSQIKRILNQTKDSLYEDCLRSFPDAYTIPKTLTADTTDPTSYIFATQSPAITDVALIVEVRITDAQGIPLTEVPFGERYVRRGYTYSLLGIGLGYTLYTGPSVSSGVAIYLAYAPTQDDLSADNDAPTWLPSAFHDVLAMRAAMSATASGNEQQPSQVLVERVSDREAQLRYAMGQRSLDPKIQRVRS